MTLIAGDKKGRWQPDDNQFRHGGNLGSWQQDMTNGNPMTTNVGQGVIWGADNKIWTDGNRLPTNADAWQLSSR
jgi:hypothetical protein